MQLTQILNDPGRMQQIKDIAGALGVATDEGIPPELPAAVTDALEKTQALDRKHEALVQALLPYLRPGRQARLEQAIRIARLSHLAGTALQTGRNHPEEETGHV